METRQAPGLAREWLILCWSEWADSKPPG
ncbi:hypothetical protein OOU_Y34scaffold00666g123 [Pyricularia oryzae Y34]|uniref:Uncharacterized protein n=3 Tax=Pyricularia oryzae TaxID=318829 RepID=Q2KGC6_PYRO7|nr:hypothetical protein MGCH7_ch7g409 [Pyricularia oryzae 70-15]ELQ36262.1 hypothetical protein OOU_Y34scaffold00666g123 [Pyricularia oryzae Y34]